MKKWQKILEEHDCEMTIVDDNTVIVHNKCYTINDKSDGTKEYVYHDETIKRENDGYTITSDIGTIETCKSIYEWLGY